MTTTCKRTDTVVRFLFVRCCSSPVVFIAMRVFDEFHERRACVRSDRSVGCLGI